MTSTLRNKQGEVLDYSFHAAERSDCLAIIGHGVTGNKDRPHLLAVAESLVQAGIPSLRLSFSGNGDSEGQFTDCTISKEIDDLTAVIDQVQAGDKKITYIGHSMGGAVGVLTAAREDRIKVLVSLAGMVNTRGFYDREFSDVTPDAGSMWDEADCPLSQIYQDDLYQISSTLDAAAQIRCPWLLVHGSEDDVVLPEDSENAFAVAQQPKQHIVLDGQTHSFAEDSQAMSTAVVDFLSKHL